MKQKLQNQFLPFNYMQAINRNDSWKKRMTREKDKGNATTCLFVNVASDSSKAANTCKEEGIAINLDNTFVAPKKDMLMNAPVYNQYKEKEEMCDKSIGN